MTAATVKQPAVRERSILFSGPMVRAILDGRKTQTRRVVNPNGGAARFLATDEDGARDAMRRLSPHGVPGDRLWVRETWFGNMPGGDEPETFHYRATDPDFWINGRSPWRGSIIMPRRASRLSLEITNVRVERLQDISEDDAHDEGLEPIVNDPHVDGYGEWTKPYVIDGRSQFRELWDSLNAKRGYGWATNPWVWVIEFAAVRA